MRIFAGNLQPGQSLAEAQKNCVESIEACAEHAARRGVLLGLENHGGIVAEADSLLAIVKAVDSDFCGINLDSGNFKTDDPYGDLERCAPYAVSVQIKTEIQPRGQEKREADLARIVEIVKRERLPRLRHPGVRGGRAGPHRRPPRARAPPGPAVADRETKGPSRGHLFPSASPCRTGARWNSVEAMQFTRRQALTDRGRRCPGSPAHPGRPGTARRAATGAKPPIKLAVSTYSYWHFTPEKYPIEKVIENAAAIGFDGVEILHRQMKNETPGYVNDLKRAAFRHGLSFPMLSIHQDFVDPDPAKRQEGIDHTIHCIELAPPAGDLLHPPQLRPLGNRSSPSTT